MPKLVLYRFLRVSDKILYRGGIGSEWSQANLSSCIAAALDLEVIHLWTA